VRGIQGEAPTQPRSWPSSWLISFFDHLNHCGSPFCVDAPSIANAERFL
jgi:hypothetical protein